MKKARKLLAIVLCVLLLISMSPLSLADETQWSNEYRPSDIGPSNAVPPRSYFPTDISQLPSSEGLPDPFKFLDSTKGTNGYVTTKEEWSERRSEISDLLQYYYYGYTAPGSDVTVSYAASDPAPTASPQARTMDITITRKSTGVKANIGVTSIYVPVYKNVPTDQLGIGETNIAGPYPFIIGVGLSVSNDLLKSILRKGYAAMSLNTGSVYSDAGVGKPGHRTGAYVTLYPFDKDTYEGDSGCLLSWAWGVSRVIDALEGDGSLKGLIDPTRSVVTGNSRTGKAALLAGAFDERISIIAPSDPGEGGTASMRYTNEGRVLNYNVPNTQAGAANADYSNSNMNHATTRNEKVTNLLSNDEAHWLDIKAEDFRFDVDKLPFDAHTLMAMCAPRPLLSFTGEGFDWLGSPSAVLDTVAAKEVYEFLGVGDNIGIRVHDGAHALQPRDIPYFMAIMDREFRQNKHEGELKVEGPSDLNVNINPPLRNAETFESVWDMASYPYEVDSSYIQWSNPNDYYVYTTNELLTAGKASTIKAYSNAPKVVLTNTATGDKFTADIKDGFAAFNLSENETKEGRYSITTSGGTKGQSTVYIQCYDLKSILRMGVTKSDAGSPTGDGDIWIVGFTSKIDRSAVKIYANDVLVPSSVNEATQPGWIFKYGVAVDAGLTSRDAAGNAKGKFFQDVVPNFPAKFPAAGTANRILRVEDLKLESLPGFNFTIGTDININATATPTNWPSTNIKIGPQPNWPQYPNKNTDTGVRPVSLPMPTTSLGAATCTGFDSKTDSVTIGFENPMDTGNFGFGTNFADDYTVTWNDTKTEATIGFNGALPTNKKDELILVRLKDTAGNANVEPYVFDLIQPLDVTTTANLVKKGDYFDVAASFQQTTATNAVSFVLSYDKDKFEYAGNLGADPSQNSYIDGLTYLTSDVKDGNVKLTMMIPNYEAKNLVSLRFRAKEDADIRNADNSVTATADYVYKNPAGDKTVLQVYGSTDFTSSGDPGDTDEDGKVTLLDLSNVIDMFGVKSGDALWAKAKFFDFNKNKVIDIADIVAVAKLIF